MYYFLVQIPIFFIWHYYPFWQENMFKYILYIHHNKRNTQLLFLVETTQQKTTLLSRQILSLIYSSMKKIAILWILASVFLAGCSQPTQTGNLDEFAQCLTEKWAIMYGSASCPHCQSQKAMFGDSFQYVTYVECTEEAERCGKELKWNVPARKFADGSIVEWKQSLAKLSAKSDCPLPAQQ